ncbi:MAG: hypothetical protein ACKOX6_10990 [Bdellovibrio sp.]
MSKLVFIILIVVPQMSAFASKDDVLLGNLQKQIGSPKAALEYVYSDSKRWNTYLDHIKKADAEWLKLWPELRKVSDAGATQQLDISFGYVLEKKPDLALTMIKGAWANEKEMQEVVGWVCASVSEAFSDQSVEQGKEKKEVLALIERRLGKLSQVEVKEITSVKNLCVDKLKNEQSFWQRK